MNSGFSFLTSCHTKFKESSLPYHLLIAGERIVGCIPFLKRLVLCEMHTVLFRIWTWVALSISYDYYHYTTNGYNLKKNGYIALMSDYTWLWNQRNIDASKYKYTIFITLSCQMKWVSYLTFLIDTIFNLESK